MKYTSADTFANHRSSVALGHFLMFKDELCLKV